MYKVAVLSALYNAFENTASGQQTTAAEVFHRSFFHLRPQKAKWALWEFSAIWKKKQQKAKNQTKKTQTNQQQQTTKKTQNQTNKNQPHQNQTAHNKHPHPLPYK